MSQKLRQEKQYQEAKCPNTLILYTLNALLSKNQFYSFFLIFWHAKIPSSFRMSRYIHNSSFIFF